MIEIPEKDLTRDIGWFRDGMGEDAVRTYLLKHPNIIETGLEYRNFLGIGVWFRKYGEDDLARESNEADMLFGKDGTYYIIEAKQRGKYYRGWQYVRLTVECLRLIWKNTTERFVK